MGHTGISYKNYVEHDLELLKKVCEQIIEDHTNKDWTAIDELFKNTSTEQLQSFLSEVL